MFKSALGCLGLVVLVIVLLIGTLVLGGVLKVGNTIIDRQVVIHSQQYVTSHNEEIANYIIDYNNVNDADPNAAGRRKSIIDSVCLEANQLDPTYHEISTSNLVFVSQHCPGY